MSNVAANIKVSKPDTTSGLRRPSFNSPASLRERWRRFCDYSLLDKAGSLAEFYWLMKTRFFYRKFFGRIGRHSRILNPMRLWGVERIFIGDDVTINKCAFLLTNSFHGKPLPRLTIGDGCTIGHMNHITCVSQVSIGRKVLTADRVHIGDNSHVFDDLEVPIVDQGVTSRGPVSIGDGSWIGEGASVLSCRIGKHCVIGSNAVVVGDIPDYCVAVGVPARVIRRFDPLSGDWVRVNRNSQ